MHMIYPDSLVHTYLYLSSTVYPFFSALYSDGIQLVHTGSIEQDHRQSRIFGQRLQKSPKTLFSSYWTVYIINAQGLKVFVLLDGSSSDTTGTGLDAGVTC